MNSFLNFNRKIVFIVFNFVECLHFGHVYYIRIEKNVMISIINHQKKHYT